MIIKLPTPEAWQGIPLYDLAWTFTRINPHAPPIKVERSDDGLILTLTFLEQR